MTRISDFLFIEFANQELIAHKYAQRLRQKALHLLMQKNSQGRWMWLNRLLRRPSNDTGIRRRYQSWTKQRKMALAQGLTEFINTHATANTIDNSDLEKILMKSGMA